MWTRCLLLLMLLATTTTTLVNSITDEELVAGTGLDEMENRTRWEAAQAIPKPINPRYVYLLHLWQQHKNSSTPTTARDILDAVTNLAFLDSRIDMISLLLFGPTKGWSIIRADTQYDDSPGLKSMLKLFNKHCGVITDSNMKKSLHNIYKYAINKEAIHEAIILACARHEIETHGVNVTNPKVDLIPAPIHGTLQYCGRVSVNVIPRTKPQWHLKAYQVIAVPSESILPEWRRSVHVCYHRNDSLEPCQCEKDDWRPIRDKVFWNFVTPPYEQRFVDVKFVGWVPNGFVTVSLREVSVQVSPAQGWRFGLYVGGVILLCMVVNKYNFAQNGVVYIIQAMVAVTFIMVNTHTPWPVVAVCPCLALCYIIYIISHAARQNVTKGKKVSRNGGGQTSESVNRP